MRTRFGFLVVLAILVAAVAAEAKDAFYRVPVANLKLTEGQLPDAEPTPRWQRWQAARARQPRVVLDGEGEAYVRPSNVLPWQWQATLRDNATVHVAAPAGEKVTGRLLLPNADWTGMVSVRFEIAPQSATHAARRTFYEAKRDHFAGLLQRNLPGAAWFRHQMRLAQHELGQRTDNVAPEDTRAEWAPGSEVDRTYALFTGGRAVSENLQLDRLLPGPRPGQKDELVSLDSIRGITVAELDWKTLTRDMTPALDPLASKIPADQHVVFFPSFQAAVDLADEVDRQGTFVLRVAGPGNEDAQTRARYERQLGISLDGLSRLLGPKMIQSVAATGSDSYYRTGTDVAVLFETKDPDMLLALLLAKVAAASAQEPDIQAASGKVAGLAYQGRSTPDRRISSYVARLDGAVVVTNSLHQLRRIAAVQSGESASLASLPEYVFFRDRYPLGDKEETALVFLSDATIRRWCGPRWRIGTSRRARAAAVLAEMQASQMDALARGTVEPGPIHTDLPLPDDARLTLARTGVISSVHGRIDFLTPIAEMPLDEVSRAEADAYERWRDGYQRNWTVGFDPIALRISVKPEALAADLSVMPLIAGTQYREFLSIAQKAKIAPTAGDPHGAPLHVIVAIDQKAPMFQRANNFASMMMKGFTLGWMGESVAVHADADPFWNEWAKTPREDWDEFLQTQVHRLPLALNVEVKNGLALTGFLAGLRGFVEQTAPGMTEWETREYQGESYVRVTPSEKAKGRHRSAEHWAICYAASGEALVVTPNEELLKRALDRQIARRKAAEEGKPVEPDARPWLGENLALQADRGVFEIVDALFRDEYGTAMQVRSWSNLPILNVWRERYPDQDPIALHERVWGIRLECPGGGRYVWNEAWQTMESTAYGHPALPKTGPAAPAMFDTFSRADFGVSFPDQGLRARVKLDREKK
ncbi:MAG: hypothetical protein JW809_06550 [Pirellulales bacterium]|nr:hypothetical protein [Pirellulales bacterium]